MRIDQFVPGFAEHDAISNHVLALQRVLSEAGIDSDIFGGEAVSPSLRAKAPWWESWRPGDPERAMLYHASTQSSMVNWCITHSLQGERLLVDYHNITPADFFARWLPDAAASMGSARRELADLAPHVRLAVADSNFNERELVEVGYPRTGTCRLLVDLERYHDPPERLALQRLRRRRDRSGAQWLFVGRMSPNKCQHDLVAALAVYRKLFDPRAGLTLVGGTTAPRYRRAVSQLAEDLGVADAVDIVDGVSHGELLAHFATADVFVCLSEHEGFCIPILEAMELRLPVVAYATAAVPETVGAGGVLLADKDPLEVACSVADLLADDDRRAALVAAGVERAGEFALQRVAAHWVETLSGEMA